MNLICQLFQRYHRFGMCMKIIQHLFQPLQFSLAGRNHISKLRVMCGKNQAKGFAEQSLDPQFITEGFSSKSVSTWFSFFKASRLHSSFPVSRIQGRAEFCRKKAGNSCVPHHFPDLHKRKIRSHKDRCIQKYGCHLWNHSYEGHFLFRRRPSPGCTS